ncbi:MAG: hypothetical protein IPK26_29130 [Planctomycetes bacterium]|nr:hypothetical protein [Planctomycetota bacterium]
MTNAVLGLLSMRTWVIRHDDEHSSRSGSPFNSICSRGTASTEVLRRRNYDRRRTTSRLTAAGARLTDLRLAVRRRHQVTRAERRVGRSAGIGEENALRVSLAKRRWSERSA